MNIVNDKANQHDNSMSFSTLSFRLASYIPSIVFSSLISIGYEHVHGRSSEMLLEMFSLLLKNTILEDDVIKELVSFVLGNIKSNCLVSLSLYHHHHS